MDNEILSTLKDQGFKLETVASGYTKIFHPDFSEHIAIIERDGSISLSIDIAHRFDLLLPRSGNVGRFQYTWRGAQRLSSEEIARRLFYSI